MNPAPNFNPLAELYRWLEYFTFGPCLQLARTAFLARFTNSRRALVLGDGVPAPPISPKCRLRRTYSPSAALSRVRIHLADVRNWEPPGNHELLGAQAASAAPQAPYDLVVTHFFLDCLTTAEVQSLAARLRPVVSPSALWVVSEFAIPPGWPGHLIALCFRNLGEFISIDVRLVHHRVGEMHLVFVPTNFEDSCIGQRVERHARLAGILVSELWFAGPANPALPAPNP